MRLLEDGLAVSEPMVGRQRTSAKERLRLFHAYLAKQDPTKPPLPPEAFERASFYGDRD